jgi:NAD(P)-dependent dehydrogenase (short-subunit alcohol dehydrogenase family)
MTELGLAGRAVLVVGAGGGGIGTAICSAVAAAGAHVIGVDSDADRLDLARAAVAAKGGDWTGIVADAGTRAAVEAFVDQARAVTGSLHGLMNVVGGLPLGRWQPLLRYSDETFDAVFDTNLRIAFRCSQQVGRVLEEQASGGSIVQLASISALQGMPFGAAYSMAKAALISLTRTMALEWGSFGVRVNAVAPGSVRVATRSQGPPNPERDRKTLPLGRQGEPDDIAGAALFLLSDLSKWMTGQVLVVDGGASIKPSYLDDDGLPVFVTDEELRSRALGEPTR